MEKEKDLGQTSQAIKRKKIMLPLMASLSSPKHEPISYSSTRLDSSRTDRVLCKLHSRLPTLVLMPKKLKQLHNTISTNLGVYNFVLPTINTPRDRNLQCKTLSLLNRIDQPSLLSHISSQDKIVIPDAPINLDPSECKDIVKVI